MSLLTVFVTCKLIGPINSSYAGATYTATLNTTEIWDGVSVPNVFTAIVNDSGVATLSLWPNSLSADTNSTYRIIATKIGTNEVFRDVTVKIPNNNCILDNLLVTPFSKAAPALSKTLIDAQSVLVDVNISRIQAASSADKSLSSANAALSSANIALGVADSVSRGPVASVNSKMGVVVLNKGDFGLGSVDNTADIDKIVSTAQSVADKTILNSAKTYADSLVVGLWDDRGSFDASINTYPTVNGSGASGSVLKGDIWTISIAASSGPLTGYAVGATVRAIVDYPVQTNANWSITSVGIGYVPENILNKDNNSGYAGLTLFKLNLRNSLNSITSWFTTSATTARTWTLPDKDGTVAMLADITGTNSGTNTGDQTNITGTASSITGVYAGSITSSQVTTALTFTPYNAINPAGYGTGTVTSVTGTGPLISTGGATPVISIPAATTTNSGYLTSADWTTFNGKQPSGTYATGTGTASGTNTGDQTNIAGTAATITGIYSGSITSAQITTGLTYTPYNSTNPAGYGTGTVTTVTATGPVVSSGGTTPVISIPAATTSVAGYLTSTDWTTFNSKQPSGTYATGTGTASGSNTGDQTNITGTASTITGIYSGSITPAQITTGLTYTPYNATNPAGYGTGTVTTVTGTGPLISTGGTTPVISIPAATTTVSGYLASTDWTTFNSKQPSGTYATGTGTASGTNTGDETLSSIKTKLSISILSGSNTGDQTNITGTAATITGVYSGTLIPSQITSGLTFTPYNATNPAGYGTGTLTAVTATGPIVSSGGTTPVISIPAANTTNSGYLTSADWTTFNGKQPSGTYATGTGTASGTNTGDQINITGTAATITGVYSGTLIPSQITSGLTYTPYNSTNPAGYGTGTVTAVTATGPVVSSGGATPVISIPAATTTNSGYLTSADWTTFNGKQPSGTYATGTGTASGTNTGDETLSSIKTKLGITVLSGSNTGDQTNITGTASTITGVYSGTLTASQITTGLAYTPYNSTNPAGYGTGTLTAVTATGPVVSSGGTTPVISIPAATTSVAGYLTSADWTIFNGKQPSGTYATGTGTASGSNTGDQTNITGTAATITGIYSNTLTSSQVTTALTFTPYNATNPAGYGTGTVTAVTATGPVVSSGGTTPVISIPAATTTVSGYLTSADWTTFNGKQPSGTYATGTGTASGTNTGDETLSSIKTKLSITVLSGSNTGDQTNITGTASTITGVYSGTLTSTQITSGLTYTPYNSTNPAGYGTGTLTAVTATGPVVSSGGTTPVISIPAATTTNSGYLTSADWTTFNGKQPSGTYATGTGTASGSNTGDETLASIKTKLGITVLSGSNTGDQTNITGTAATITGIYSNTLTSSQVTTALTFTPYNATNPAGYGTGTLTAVTATGPVVSSGGTTPIISIPAATTTVSGYLTSADWTTFNGKQPSGTYATGTGTASGTNTGDQTNITGTAATITGVYSGTLISSQITSGLTFTPYNSTNPAGYGTGTLTAVTATGPVVSSGGTTPIISIPAATTTVSGYLTSADWTTFNNKAQINSPSFIGIPIAPTAIIGNSTTQLATTAFVQAAVNLVSNGVISFSYPLTLTTAWQDVGISGSQLVTGSYMIQLYVDDYAVGGGHYTTTYTGTMAWYSGGTNSTSFCEIPLHSAGQASNNNAIFLRTLQSVSGGFIKLQIATLTNNTGAATYAFKFKQII